MNSAGAGSQQDVAAQEDKVRIRLDLSYDGTDFSGWAIQPDRRTVQGTLEQGLEQILRLTARKLPAARLTVAGRTDAGVHARQQVAHMDIPTASWLALPGRSDREPGQALVARLGGVLAQDVVVHAASWAPAGFDARFSASQRRYVYRIADTPLMYDPLRRSHVLWTRQALDIDAMNQAAGQVLGLHDFEAFSKPRPGATTIRTLLTFHWQRHSDGPDAGLVTATVIADAFCHNMVRSLVGASMAVGQGRKDAGWLRTLLQGVRQPGQTGGGHTGDGQRAGTQGAGGKGGGALVKAPVISAHGLTLEEVLYPPDDQLATRAKAIRAQRNIDNHAKISSNMCQN